MNRGSPELRRRTLLAAACAAPLVRHPGLGPGPRNTAAIQSHTAASLGPGLRRDDEEWRKTLARFRSAESSLAALEGDPDEDAYGRAHDRFNLALRRLLAAPAPDVAALATKLETAVAAELADLTYAPPSLAPLAEDARRLSLRSP